MQLVFNRKNDVELSDDGSGTTGCFTTSPSLTLRPTTPTQQTVNNKTPSTSRSSDETFTESTVHSPQVHRLKLIRKGTRMDIFV